MLNIADPLWFVLIWPRITDVGVWKCYSKGNTDIVRAEEKIHMCLPQGQVLPNYFLRSVVPTLPEFNLLAILIVLVG